MQRKAIRNPSHGSSGSMMGGTALLLAAMIWGLGYVVTTDSLNILHADYLMAYRYFIALAGMLLYLQIKRLAGITRRVLYKGALLGLLLYLSQYLQTIACGHTTVGRVSFITALYVLFVPALERLIYHKKIFKTYAVVALTAAAGLYLLTRTGGSVTIGDLAALGGSVGFAFHILLSDRFTRDEDVCLLTTAQFGGAFLLSVLILLVKGRPLIAGCISLRGAGQLFYLGAVSTMTGFFLQMWGQKRVSSFLTAMLLATEALFGLLFSVLFLQERVTVPMSIGCALMLTAILAAKRKST